MESGNEHPVAWIAFDGDTAITALRREPVQEIADRHGWKIAPLYRSPAITPEERDALEIACEYVGSAYQVESHAVTLRRLLERLA